MDIPLPPDNLFEDSILEFTTSDTLDEWAREMFIDEDAELANPQHSHLQFADLGFLWTTHHNVTKGRRVIGMAEIFSSRTKKWIKARQEQQLRKWFGDIPDFIITIDASFWRAATNPERFALIEHELYHCGQSMDESGAPRFNQSTGKPVFSIRGHDVEEFIGVVERYGAEATGISEMVRAANQGPQIAKADIEGLCGTCKKKVA